MKNVWLISLGVVALLSLTNGYLLRSEEHIRNRENMLKHVGSFAENFINEYTNYTQTGLRTKSLESMLNMMQIPIEVARKEFVNVSPEAAIMSCVACRSTLGLLIQQFRSGSRTREQLKQDAVGLCMQLTTFGIVVCEGVVELNADIIFYILEERPTLNANQVCSFVLQGECGDPPAEFNFAINVSPGQPITGPKADSVPRNPNEWRVLHFSDPHYDPVSKILFTLNFNSINS
jgi:hypothetical protein